MKRCPFCNGGPLKHLETVGCSTCKIFLPLKVWEGRLSTEHMIDGVPWVTEGTVLKNALVFKSRLSLVLKSDMEAIFQGDWESATPAGFCRAGRSTECHRYKIGSGKKVKTFLIQCRLEQDAVDLGARRVDAKAIKGGGFIARYCTDELQPILYVASLKADTVETL